MVKIKRGVVKIKGCVVKIERGVVKKVTFSLHFCSPPCSVPTLPVALREAADVADSVLTWSWLGA
jgi:hypothetical protein